MVFSILRMVTMPRNLVEILIKNSIHVQYTRIDSSRLRALTTRLTGSLVAGGNDIVLTGSKTNGCRSVQNVDESSRLDRVVTTRSNTCRLDSIKVEHGTRHTMY